MHLISLNPDSNAKKLLLYPYLVGEKPKLKDG